MPGTEVGAAGQRASKWTNKNEERECERGRDREKINVINREYFKTKADGEPGRAGPGQSNSHHF